MFSLLLKPEYAQNIIVGVKTSSQFSWYLTERDVWILDIVKYKKLYERNGFSFDMDFALSLRNNISVVNEKNYRLYLQEYTDYIVPTSELKKLVEHQDYGSTILELRPSLFIDFNQKKLLSLYPELLPFENYVPNNWSGIREDFTSYIPEEERYWIFDNINYIDKLFNEKESKGKI
ncbi:hypothetical protein C2I17_23655 [Niallia circulans]|uniref:hypothetical protein n=1 Tax=Niallia circulans TaxID=1397 RepID=UPI00201DCE55|nr:hypothetical protein [Niallia circulans]UQZ77300.1 hypothetical protein C2I17_23655 [Niallia circulans]